METVQINNETVFVGNCVDISLLAWNKRIRYTQTFRLVVPEQEGTTYLPFREIDINVVEGEKRIPVKGWILRVEKSDQRQSIPDDVIREILGTGDISYPHREAVFKRLLEEAGLKQIDRKWYVLTIARV